MDYLEGAWAPEQLEDFSKSYAPEAAGSYGIPKSWFNDPFAMLDSMGLGYRANPSALGYETLKQMGEKSVIPLAVIQTRVNQTSAFAQRQRNKYSVGMKVQHKDPHHKLTDRDRDHIKNLLGFVENMGVDRDCERDTFDTFVRKCVRDRLVYDQFCAEKVLRRSGKPHSIFAIDSATIRRVAPKDRRGTPLTKREALTTPKYVQVIDGTIANEYTQKELMFRVANPRTDLRVHGYGYSELEMLINTITSHLWAEEWNRKAFCVAPGSYVTTRNGLRLIDDLAGTEFEAWNGRTWSNATAYQTGKKGLVCTKLWNGLELETSQKHKFKVIPRESETGEAVWRTQQELKHGDVALLGYTPSDGALDEASFLVGKEYLSARSWGSPWKVTLDVVKDVEFWEMLGFALGDGYWPELGALDANGNRKPQWLRTMPHATLDTKVFVLFLRVCERHGINGKQGVANPGDKRADGEFGYPIVDIQHKAFIEWLYDLGFNSSARGKRIPAVIMQGPVWMRSALLRGLFSADGHTHRHSTKGYATPAVHCSAYPLLRQDILRCLWSVGVASNEVGEGWSRRGEIDVQDVGAFVERIGYLQDYKNADITREPGKESLWDRLHPAWSARIAAQLRASDKSIWEAFSSQDRNLICMASREVCGLSRPKAISFLRRFGLPVPAELYYVQVSVDVLDDEAGPQVQMFDVEVFDEEHTFLLNHVAVHNSQGATTKGILNLQGNIPAAQLDAFRRQFITQVSGVANAWRTPIMNSDGLQWIPLQPSNNEMGYQQWLEYLIKVTCSIFLIDPAEVNFDTRGGVGSQPMFMTTNEAQQKISKDRGLQPLLRYVQTLVNEEIIQEIDPEYEFIFVGIDAQTEQQAIELRSKELATYKTLNEIRREEDLAPVEHGDVVLNPVYTGLRQQEQLAAQQAAQAAQQGGVPTGGPPPGTAPPGQREQFEKLFGGGNPEKRPSFGTAERALGSHIEGEVKTEAAPEEATDDFSQEETQNSWEGTVHASLRMQALHARLSDDVKKAMSAFEVA